MFSHEEEPIPIIEVREDLREDFETLTVLHEWVHAWLYMSDIGPLLQMEDETEELFCTILAINIRDLIEHLEKQKNGDTTT